MSWSVTVNDLQGFEEFDLETLTLFSSQHPAYPRDAVQALALAKAVGLKSATLSGGRTPNPYGGDEIVDISVRGTPRYNDFLSEMREILQSGPDKGSTVAKHYEALAILRASPCPHEFYPLSERSGEFRCVFCGVCLNGTMLYFEEKEK